MEVLCRLSYAGAMQFSCNKVIIMICAAISNRFELSILRATLKAGKTVGDGFSVEGAGFEPAKASPTDLQSVPFGHSGIPPRKPLKSI